jgi:hypothetical protein
MTSADHALRKQQSMAIDACFALFYLLQAQAQSDISNYIQLQVRVVDFQ